MGMTISRLWRACKATFWTVLAVDTAHTTYYLHQLAITNVKDESHTRALHELRRSVVVLPFLRGYTEGVNHANEVLNSNDKARIEEHYTRAKNKALM